MRMFHFDISYLVMKQREGYFCFLEEKMDLIKVNNNKPKRYPNPRLGACGVCGSNVL